MEITTTMIVQDNEIKEFTCFTCQKRFPLISDLTRHLTSEHKPDETLSLFATKPKSWRDSPTTDGADCVVTEPSSASEERSERQNTSKSRFFCSVCNRGFALKHHVVRHEEKIHDIVRPRMRQQNRLDSAPKTVVYVPNEAGGMTSHLQPLHQEPSISSTTDLTTPALSMGPRASKPRPHICEICAKGFTQRHHLKRHMDQAHKLQKSDDAEVSSESCLAVVPVTLSETDGVIVARTDKPLHRCSSCYRGFTERHHMIRHEKTVHESKKDHHCILCGKHFSQKHHLLNHQIAIHCKTRNYSCSVCSKKFSLKHQLQRHEKRVHNTQILADGTVIKKRRQKKEIGPDGKPRITWVGGEVIGFAGPPAASGGEGGGEGGGGGGNDSDDIEAESEQPTDEAKSNGTFDGNDVDGSDVGESRDVDGPIPGQRVNDDDNGEGAASRKVFGSATASEGQMPSLPAVKGEERHKVEALFIKLSGSKPIQTPAPPSATIESSLPPLLPAASMTSDLPSTGHFSPSTPPPQSSRSTPSLTASSPDSSPAMKTSHPLVTSRDSAATDILVSAAESGCHGSVGSDPHNSAVADPHRSTASGSHGSDVAISNAVAATSRSHVPSAATSVGSANSNLEASPHLSGTNRVDSDAPPQQQPQQHLTDPMLSPAISSAILPPNSSNALPHHASVRQNPQPPKHQFLPPSLFAATPSAGFQASPFFHMASNVISGLAPMDGVAEANRKWAFLGDANAASAVGAALPNSTGIASQNLCNFQGSSTSSNPTTTQSSFLPSQSAHYPNSAYPISMNPHQTQFPPL